MNSAEIVLTQINRQVTRLMYGEYADITVNIAAILEIVSTLQGAMHKVLSERDCWKMAVACGSMWVNLDNTEMFIVCYAISDAYCSSDYHGSV